MTAVDLYYFSVGHSKMVTFFALLLPGLVCWLAYGLLLAGREGPSQQVANGGIAIGLAAVILEALAVAYAISVAKVNPVSDAPAAFLAIPVYLLVAGFAVEHLVHPGEQRAIRQKIRGFLIVGATVAVISAIFSVLRIYMIVLSGMLGFLLFILALVGLSFIMIRRVV